LSNEKIGNKTLYTLSIFLEIAKTTLLLSASNIQMVGKSLYESGSFRPT
jgi:DNA topoisomerase IA